MVRSRSKPHQGCHSRDDKAADLGASHVEAVEALKRHSLILHAGSDVRYGWKADIHPAMQCAVDGRSCNLPTRFRAAATSAAITRLRN